MGKFKFNLRLEDIPSEVLQKLIDIRHQKKELIRHMKYEEIAKLRDTERDIVNKYWTDLSDYDKVNINDLIVLSRDKKINQIFDVN